MDLDYDSNLGFEIEYEQDTGKFRATGQLEKELSSAQVQGSLIHLLAMCCYGAGVSSDIILKTVKHGILTAKGKGLRVMTSGQADA